MVYGVEIVPEAIENARENAALNGITNAGILCREGGGSAAGEVPGRNGQSGRDRGGSAPERVREGAAGDDCADAAGKNCLCVVRLGDPSAGCEGAGGGGISDA